LFLEEEEEEEAKEARAFETIPCVVCDKMMRTGDKKKLSLSLLKQT